MDGEIAPGAPDRMVLALRELENVMPMFETLDGELDALCPISVVGKRRHTCVRRVLIQSADSTPDGFLLGNTQNISQEGIAVVVARPIQVGLVLKFQIARTVRFGHNLLEGVVVHATPRGPTQWLVGCKLSVTLSQSELEQFLDEA
jgi:PilZ domain